MGFIRFPGLSRPPSLPSPSLARSPKAGTSSRMMPSRSTSSCQPSRSPTGSPNPSECNPSLDNHSNSHLIAIVSHSVMPHSFIGGEADVCLIVKDLEKGWKENHENTVHHYKELLGEKQVSSINEV